jgi:hypothetical protein
MPAGEVKFRLRRADDVPVTNPEALAFSFGLQDTKGQIVAGRRDGQGLVFDFSLTAKPGKDPNHPNFTGRFASGPPEDRFVYLSWKATARGDYINRLKARLGSIDWALVEEAQRTGRPISADLSGRGPGAGRTPIDWRLEPLGM